MLNEVVTVYKTVVREYQRRATLNYYVKCVDLISSITIIIK